VAAVPAAPTDPAAGPTSAAAWARLLAPFGAPAGAVAAAHADLVRRHAEPARRYHVLAHVAEVLDGVAEVGHLATDPTAVRLAAWYHDAVYDPRAAGNEEASADLAAGVLPGLGVPAGVVAEVHRLVLLTAGHEVAEGDADGAVLADADLAVLGAPAERYARYRADVRAEWAWLPEDRWREGRAAVLRSFLDRPRIYRTPPMAAEREARARVNLAAELAAMG
jgi:predicted metal-dependent HD superfamily phosphohydrolase